MVVHFCARAPQPLRNGVVREQARATRTTLTVLTLALLVDDLDRRAAAASGIGLLDDQVSTFER
jgi:hypothetical protein